MLNHSFEQCMEMIDISLWKRTQQEKERTQDRSQSSKIKVSLFEI